MKELIVEQGTQEWFDARLAKFTSSELHKLFKSGRAKDQLFGETAKTYILEKVAEIMTNGLSIEYKAFESNATDWGKEYEDEARALFSELTGYEVRTCGFYEYDEFFGGSPDGIVNGDEILEIKCPYQSKNHVANLCCKNADDLKNLSPEYYIQMQGNMLSTGAKRGWFVSYDPRFSGDLIVKIIEVERDEELILEAKHRLAEAAGLINEYLKSSMNIN